MRALTRVFAASFAPVRIRSQLCHLRIRRRQKAALRPPGEVKRKKPPGAPKAGAAPRALAELEGLVTATADGTAAAAPVRAKAPKPVVEMTADMMRKSKARQSSGVVFVTALL